MQPQNTKQQSNNKPTEAPRSSRPLPVPAITQDAYLRAASASRVPVAIHFVDGEVLQPVVVLQVCTYTIIVSMGNGQHLLYKNALKRISPVDSDQHGEH